MIEQETLPHNLTAQVPTGRTDWRALATWCLPPELNMALDEVLLDEVAGGAAPAVRFYSWSPATLSLGVNQPLGEVDPEECRSRGFSIVRRMTGGRAVLHQYELTYSLVAPESDPRVGGGVVESYRKISAALVHGLRLLGADVDLAPPSRALHRALLEARRVSESTDADAGSHGAVCFDAASDYEITHDGKKLVGSAQARRGGAILQHGSVLLEIDWDAWASVFRYRTEAGRERARLKLPQRMTSLAEALGRTVSPVEVAGALKKGFEEAHGLKLAEGAPSAEEWLLAERLVASKYGTTAWTARK